MSITIHNHRDEISEYCPYCNFKQDGLEWLRDKIDMFNSDNKDKIVVLSECPNCFEKSWAHYNRFTTDLVLQEMESEMIVK